MSAPLSEDLKVGQRYEVAPRVTNAKRPAGAHRAVAADTFPRIGDALTPSTRVLALRQDRRRADWSARGFVLPGVTMVGRGGRVVLDHARATVRP